MKSSLSLRQLLLLSFSLTLLLGVAGLLLLINASQTQIANGQAILRLHKLEEDVNRRIAASIEERHQDLRLLARQIEGSQASQQEREALFNHVLLSYRGYAWLGMTDINGKVLAASNGHLTGQSAAEREWFRQGLVAPYISSVHRALLLARLLPADRDGLPPRLLDIALPLHRNGQVNGVIAAHLNWDWLDEILGEYEADAAKGMERQILLLDQSRQVFRGAARAEELSLPSQESWQSEEDAVRHWEDGQWSYVAHELNDTYGLTPSGWLVVIRERRQALLDLDAQQFAQLGLSVAPFVLLLVLAFIALGRHVVRPLEQISAAAHAGEDLPAVTGSYREAVELHDSLQRMTTALRSQQAAVEAEVEARMAEINMLLDALNSHTLVTMADQEGNITYVNDRFCEVSGYGREEALGQNHRVVKSGLHTPEFYADIWRTITAGRIWSGVICNRAKNGQLYWVKSVIAPARQPGSSRHAYVSVRTDITEQIESQHYQEELSQMLLQRGAMLSLLHEISSAANAADAGGPAIDQALAAVCHFMHWPLAQAYSLDEDSEEEVLFANRHSFGADQPRFAALREASTGLRFLRGQGFPGEVLAHGSLWQASLEELQHQPCCRLEALRASGIRQLIGVPLQAGERLLGVLEFATDESTLLTEEQQEILSTVSSQLGNVVQRHLSARAQAAAVAAAERANTAKTEFLSSMSHELRTPLNAIIGFAQMLEYDDTLNADQQDNVQEILKAGHHLLALINEVLDLARIESGRIELSLEPVRVEEVVAECWTLIQPLAERRGLRLQRSSAGNRLVQADRMRLKQCLLNLLSNAVKYNNPAGSIAFSCTQDGEGRQVLRVHDTGPGIPPERLAELFQPFNRLGAQFTEIEGTGIGLSITRRLVELMGGQITVHSVVGQGSDFCIVLPSAIQPASLPQENRDRNDAANPTGSAPVRLRQVLYIDDNPANLKLVAQILKRRQHLALRTAPSADLGLELALAEPPELILLDINMPGMDGYQTLEVLRASTTLKHIPVVAVTANAMPRDIDRGLAAGFADYLTKPLDVPRFLTLLDQILPPDGT